MQEKTKEANFCKTFRITSSRFMHILLVLYWKINLVLSFKTNQRLLMGRLLEQTLQKLSTKVLRQTVTFLFLIKNKNLLKLLAPLKLQILSFFVSAIIHLKKQSNCLEGQSLKSEVIDELTIC